MSGRRLVVCGDCGQERENRARGLCGTCYARARRAGTHTDAPLLSGKRVLSCTWQVDPTQPLLLIIERFSRAFSAHITSEEVVRRSPITYEFHRTRLRTYLTLRADVASDGLAAAPEPRLRPHGTHAAFWRHKNRGEVPCPVCVEGERLYHRDRKRRASRRRQEAA